MFRCLVLLLCLFTSLFTSAAQFPLRTFSSVDGLLQNDVYRLYQDKRGYLWFATYSGLSRFDGKRFISFDENNSGIASNLVKSITEDTSGQLWVGFPGGFAKLVENRFVNFSQKDGLLDDDVNDLIADNEQGLWILSSKGVSYFNAGSFTNYPVDNVVPGNTLMAQKDNGDLYLATIDGLFLLTRGTSEFIKVAIIDFPPVALHFDSATNNLYLIDRNNLYIYRNLKTLEKIASPLDGELVYMNPRNQGGLWVYSEDELWRFNSQQDNQVYGAEILGNPSLSHVIDDREGGIILGQWGGFSIIKSTDIINFKDGVAGNNVYSLFRDDNGDLYYSANNGAARYAENFELIAKFGDVFSASILKDGDFVYVATEEQGLHLYSKYGRYIKEIATGYFASLYKDKKGKIWVGSYTGLYSLKDNKLVKELSSKEGLTSNTVLGIFEDNESNLWLGTENGVAKFDGKKWFFYNKKDGLSNQQVWTIMEDKKRGVLFTTAQGISVYKNGKLSTFPLLKDKAVNSLHLDHLQQLWVACLDGLYRINPNNEVDLHLTISHGLPIDELSNHGLSSDKEWLYVASYNGISKIKLDIQQPKVTAPMLDLVGLEINQQKQKLSRLQQPLDYQSNHLVFHFNAIFHSIPELVEYQYQLVGLDKTWLNPSEINQAIYTNLSPGKYSFNVKAVVEGIESDIQTISFTIQAPWWKSIWACLLYTVLLIMLVIAVVRLIRLLRLKIKEQTIELEAQLADLKSGEQALIESRNKERQANQAKSIFLANMSHEIRTPLNAIINLSKNLAHKSTEKNSLNQLNIIGNSGDHLLRVINDILDISQIESQQFELKPFHFDLFSCMEATIETLNVIAANKQLHITVNCEGIKPNCVFLDGVRLRQVMFNLVNNAIKFTERGAIQVNANISGVAPTYQLAVQVVDSGIGIKADDLQKLFTNFQQIDNSTTREYEGTGLGLSISKQLIELMGGQIEVSSEYGKGSTFSFQIPLDVGDVNKIEKQHEDCSVSLENKSLSILVVDDNETNLEVCAIFFAEQGVQVQSVNSGQLAIQALTKKHFDIVLMDIEMPVVDGVQCCAMIRKGNAGHANKNIPIIMLSAHSTILKQEQCFAVGADGYIAKPIDFNSLFEQINQLVTKPQKKCSTEATLKPTHQQQFKALFEQEATVIFVALEVAFLAQDKQAMRQLAHKHKSSMAMLGYVTLVDLFNQLEVQCKQDATVSKDLYEAIIKQLNN